MNHDQGIPASASGPGEDLRAGMVSLISGVMGLRLPAEHWDEVGVLLRELDEALAAGDHGALATAVDGLEVIASVRVVRIGSGGPAPGPPPDERREQAADLVQRIGARGTAPEPDGGTGAGSAGR